MNINKLEITQPSNAKNETNTSSSTENISIDLINNGQSSTSLTTDTISEERYKDQNNNTANPTLKMSSLTNNIISGPNKSNKQNTTHPTNSIHIHNSNNQILLLFLLNKKKKNKKKNKKQRTHLYILQQIKKTHKTHLWKPTHQLISPAQIYIDVF
jgi:hypothetical protein